MWNHIVYLKSNRRMPVRLSPSRYPQDVQQILPVSWCPGCGAELHSAHKALCRRCEGGTEDEQESLYDLQPGEVSGCL